MVTECRLRYRRGQALVELAVGLVVVSLVLSGLFAFTDYIIASLNEQRTMRAEAGRSALGGTGGDGSFASESRHRTIVVSSMAADYIFGSTTVEIRDEVHLPLAGIQGGM